MGALQDEAYDADQAINMQAKKAEKRRLKSLKELNKEVLEDVEVELQGTGAASSPPRPGSPWRRSA